MKDKEPKEQAERLVTVRFGTTFVPVDNPGRECIIINYDKYCIFRNVIIETEGQPYVSFAAGTDVPEVIQEITGQWSFERFLVGYRLGWEMEQYWNENKIPFPQEFENGLRTYSKKKPITYRLKGTSHFWDSYRPR